MTASTVLLAVLTRDADLETSQEVDKAVHRALEPTPDQYGLAYENVSFRSRGDGLRLDGWLIQPDPVAARRPPVVMVHGWSQNRASEAHAHVLDIATHLVHGGHTVLMFDLRGWGTSEGSRFSLGPKEVRDVGGAIDFLGARGLDGDGLDLLGYSMGAATSLMIAPSEPRVRAVIEDSGYAELGSILDQHVPEQSGLPSIFTPGSVLVGSVLTGANLYAVSPLSGIALLASRGVPLLVIHGEADTLVPVAHGRRLAAMYGLASETYFVPGAEHVRAYEADPAGYLARVDAFYDRAVTSPLGR
ncbi:MAG: alpha/beta fold hydrolase [Chloroflexi bacterium]|nr:alpha/beta fold hydrolase [Chloroflexota bacterium]